MTRKLVKKPDQFILIQSDGEKVRVGECDGNNTTFFLKLVLLVIQSKSLDNNHINIRTFEERKISASYP